MTFSLVMIVIFVVVSFFTAAMSRDPLSSASERDTLWAVTYSLRLLATSLTILLVLNVLA